MIEPRAKSKAGLGLRWAPTPSRGASTSGKEYRLLIGVGRDLGGDQDVDQARHRNEIDQAGNRYRHQPGVAICQPGFSLLMTFPCTPQSRGDGKPIQQREQKQGAHCVLATMAQA